MGRLDPEVVFGDVPPEKLPDAGDSLRDAARNIEIDDIPEEHPITTSMGFAYFSKEDKSVKDVLARADEALYRAKDAGRDNWKI